MTLKTAIAAALMTVAAATTVAAETVTLTIWGIDTEPRNATKQLAEEFAAQNDDIDVVYRHIQFSDLNEEYMRSIATNTGPDIFMVNTTDTQFYAKSGAMLDLTDRVAASDIIDFDAIFPGYQAAVTYDGRIWQIPRGANTLMIYYNESMLRDAGIDPADEPRSWAQLSDYAKRLTDPEERVFGIAFSAKNNQEGPWQWLPFARMAGAEFDRIDHAGAIAALQMWRDFVADGLASQEVLVWSQSDAADAFRAERAAMVIQGSWDVGTMAQAPFAWGLWMLPPQQDGGPRVSAAGDFTYGINARSENPDEAFALVEYIYSQSHRIWNEFSKFPPYPVAPEAPDHPEAYSAFMKQLEYGRVLGPHERWNDISASLQTAIQSTLAGRTEPAEALERAASEIDRIIN